MSKPVAADFRGCMSGLGPNRAPADARASSISKACVSTVETLVPMAIQCSTRATSADCSSPRPRDLHAAARRADRERRAALDRARPRRRLQRPPVGDRRLRADPRGLRAGGGVAGRQGRPQARLHARAGDLHRFVAGLRAGSRPALPGRLARGAGDRRGDDVRHLAGADRAGVPGSRARDRARHLGRDQTGATIVAFALGASIFSMFLYITLFFQNVRGFSPFEAGSGRCRSPGRSCSSRR
jgi:hypothetical protein